MLEDPPTPVTEILTAKTMEEQLKHGIYVGRTFLADSKTSLETKILNFCKEILFPCHLNGFWKKTKRGKTVIMGRVFRCSCFNASKKGVI